jgi:dihydroorotase
MIGSTRAILFAREGCAYLKPLQTLTAGIPFGRPYSAPFSVR